MKKVLSAFLALSLAFCFAAGALPVSAAGVSAIPDDVTKITPVCGDEGGATVELNGKSAVIHVAKSSHPDPEHPDDPSYTVCNGAIFPLDGYAFTKADDLYCMVDISTDTAFRITIQDSLNNKWMNAGKEFWNSFNGVTAEQVTADYFIPAGTYQAAIYIEGYYAANEIPGDNRNIFQVEVDGLTPGTITLNNITFLPKADCQTDNGVVVYTAPDGSAAPAPSGTQATNPPASNATQPAGGSANTGEESHVLMFVTIGVLAVAVVVVGAAAAKRAKSR